MQYVCISKLLEEALQVLSLQAPGVFFSNLLYVRAHKLVPSTKKIQWTSSWTDNTMFVWVSRNCTSTKNIDEARGKLGFYIADYYISLCLSVSLSLVLVASGTPTILT